MRRNSELVDDSASVRPMLKENVWHIIPGASRANLYTVESSYNVPVEAAQAFLKMRSYCTGHNSIEVIAARSGMPVEDVVGCLNSLHPSGIVLLGDSRDASPSEGGIRAVMVKLTNLWANELKQSYIGNAFANGSLPRHALIGWLLEMYHYIKDFPNAIACAAERAEGELRQVLTRFADEERGHEVFALRTLCNLGLTAAEVESSHPMLSTRLISLLMRSMFEIEPSSALLLAALVEAQEFDEAQMTALKQRLDEHYGVGAMALDPYFEHQRIDVSLGHAEMLNESIHLLRVDDREKLDSVVNTLHDIKHAFELQGLEIRNYYSDLNGKYVPRQTIGMIHV